MAESLACHTPVIARRSSAIPFVAPEGRASLLWDTEDEFVSALTTILTNRNLRNELGDWGYRYIADSFTIEKSKEKLLHLYDEFKR